MTQDQPEDSPAVTNAIAVVTAAAGPAPTPSTVLEVLRQLCPGLPGVQVGAVLSHFDGAGQ